jgi:uncharacterized OB-fold protein
MEKAGQEVRISPPAEVDVDETTAPWWAALRDGALTMQRCADCHAFRMPPSPHCPNCLSTKSEWPKLSGRATLYSYTAIPLDRWASDGPVYVAALACPVEAGDNKLFCNIVGCATDELAVGMELELVRAEAGREVALFRPVRAGGGR